ncbi:hypothetical protein HYW94_02565 [Candidatus Uhrbacteria bacterium]|nr:hypothetical protein [Candidatus Uhrbacteria bacterium]
MGWSPFVNRSYGFGRDEWIRDMVKERQAREREAVKNPVQAAAKKPSRDTLELSSRQSQRPGPVQFAPQPIPVPIYMSGIDYMV